MQRSRDEAFSMYGLLAETVEWDEARSFIQFNLNPKAKWSDGKPVTPEDVIFTFELLRDKGRVPFSTRLAKVAKMEKVGEQLRPLHLQRRKRPGISAAAGPLADPAETCDRRRDASTSHR